MLTGALSSTKGERGTGVVDKRPWLDQRSHVDGDHGRSGGRGRRAAGVEEERRVAGVLGMLMFHVHRVKKYYRKSVRYDGGANDGQS